MKFIAQNDLKITLKEKRKTHRVFIKDISYIQSSSYLSSVHFIDGRKPIIVAKLLKYFEEELGIYGFLRICRNTLFNKRNVQLLYTDNTRKILMDGGAKLTISCRKYSKINQILKN